MLVPLSWLREYVMIEVPVEDLAHRLTMAGVEVGAVERVGAAWEQVFVGRVESLEPHPRSATLQIARVDVGAGQRTLVTGATNLAVGDHVPVVLAGGALAAGAIGSRSFDGVESQGMLCSGAELGIAEDRSGIYVLEADAPIGAALADYLADVVLDLDVTPNRPDLLSVVGVAREVGALTGTPLRLPETAPPAGPTPVEQLVTVAIEAPDLCPRYSATVVEGVRVGPSPLWLQRRLHLAGMRPISNVVDVTNYVMLELGQPLHAFDADTLRGGIVVRRARPGERLRTLDDVERELSLDMLVIADAERPIAVAGVMGGAATEVSAATTRLVLESAYFEPRSVRRTGRALRLPSEASRRFERGVDPGGTTRAAARATALIVEMAGGQAAAGHVDVYPAPEPPHTIQVTAAGVSGLLGQAYSADVIGATLRSLGFGVDDNLLVRVPSFRRDVEGPADVAEEVVRIHGYDTIPTALPAGRLPEPWTDPRRPLAETTKRTLVACGYQEVITYSLVDGSELRRLDSAADWPPSGGGSGPPPPPNAGGSPALPPADAVGSLPPLPSDPGGSLPPQPPNPRGSEGGGLIPVHNPMSQDRAYLRATLLGSLLETVAANVRHHERVYLFELASVYLPPLDPLPAESLRLGLALTGPRAPAGWNQPAESGDFYDLKGAIESVLRALWVPGIRFAPERHPTLHPGRSAAVFAGDVRLGVCGQVHPLVAERYELEGRAVYAAELEFDALVRVAGEQPPYGPLPRLPGVTMDLAVVVGDDVPEADVDAAIREAGGPLLAEVRLFDVYRGTSIPAGHKSLAYALVYRAPDRTLTDAETAASQAAVEAVLQQRFRATIRGR
jgi:phenylalanyl-tRNA synthetase beta chain